MTIRSGALAAALLCLPAAAEANVVYDWVSPDPRPIGQLVVSDEAYASGRLAFSLERCNRLDGCISTTGDPSGFVGFPFVTPQQGVLIVDLTFNPDGTLDGTFDERGSMMDFRVSGEGMEWSGVYQIDGPSLEPCCLGVSGYFMREGAALTLAAYTTVPEPTSIALLLAGMAMFTLFTPRKETI